MRYQAIVGPKEVVSGKPFTDSEHTEREAAVMRVMLEREREWARSWAGNGAERGHIAREPDEEGRRHLLVVPDVAALRDARDVTAVGFFSRPREEVDHEILFSLEEELVTRMPAYAEMGLLSYYDVELVKGAYGNLILFSTPDVPPEWHADTLHRRAVKISPGHYYEVRLHKGSIDGPLMGQGTIAIERTKYFDFKADEIWYGLRRFEDAVPG
jgi:hypothetical protein